MGDEYGEYGGGDPDNRHMFRSATELNARESGLLQAIRKLGTVRREIPALRRGGYQSLGSTEDVVTYSRSAIGEKAVVAVNISESPQNMNVNLAGLGFTPGSPEDHLGFGGEMQVTGDQGAISLPPRSCAVFTP